MSNFDGQRVAIFEARMAGNLADLVARHGGVPVPAPALREIRLDDNPAALSFADSLLAGAFDVVVFETGVGVRYLAESLAPRLARPQWAEALRAATVVARGPKPAVALRELGVRIDLQVPEPNTYRETLALLDEHRPVAGLTVAVQEYGKPIPELTDGLEARGATVIRVPVYRWALPDDLGPLQTAIRELIAGEIVAVLFTASQQVEHVLQVAGNLGIEPALRDALTTRVVVGSVGPLTTAALRSRGLPADIEPEHPKSGHLVTAVAGAWRSVPKPSVPPESSVPTRSE